MAPELLNGSSSKVSEKVDVFSFGIVLWEILIVEEPYANMHYGAIIGGIVSNTLRPPIPKDCDGECRRLMELCWSPNPMLRPSFTEITNKLRVVSHCVSSPQVSTSVVELYNSLLSTHSLLEHTDVFELLRLETEVEDCSCEVKGEDAHRTAAPLPTTTSSTGSSSALLTIEHGRGEFYNICHYCFHQKTLPPSSE